MKKNLNPWLNFPHQMQRFSSLNSATDLMEPNIGRQNNPLMVCPTYINHCGCVVPSNTTIMFPEIQARKSFEMASSINFSAIPMFVPPDFGGSTKRLPVLNQSWERTGLDLSSSLHPYRTLNHANESLDVQGSNETVHIGHEVEEMHEDLSSSLHPYRTLNHANESLDVQGSNETVHIGHEVEEMHEDLSSSLHPYRTLNHANESLDVQGSNETVHIGHEVEEMHEDSEEIDALLYSDSDDDDSREEEDASTGHSPIGPMTGSSSEVASSIFPVKRKRLDGDEPDALLMDTATSGGHHGDNSDLDFNKHRIEGGDSSCVRGEDQDRKRLKRERILETVSALRRIIPGGEGKDAATVIDEAIFYVKSLKLKAKDLGQKLSGVAGSPAYVAPEVLLGDYSEKVDIWAAGVLLHLLLVGGLPFNGGSLEAVFEAIKKTELDFTCGVWESISELARDLLSRMLTRDVSKRITADEILNHSWILFYTKCPSEVMRRKSVRKNIKPIIDVERIAAAISSTLSIESSSSKSEEQDGCCFVDALAAAMSHVSISETKRTRLCGPVSPIQQQCSSNMESNLWTAF